MTAATRRRRSLATLVIFLPLAAPLLAVTAAEGPTVSGQVLGESEPIAAAEVYAWEIASAKLEKVLSDHQGRFLFEGLPAGLYKIIGHKRGFLPTVELLLRRRADAAQVLDLRLAVDRPGDLQAGESFWETRSRIPPDILRQITHSGLSEPTAGPGAVVADGATLHEARMATQGGTTDVGEGSAQVVQQAFDVRGSLGGTEVSLAGRLTEIAPTGASTGLPEGEVKNLALRLSHADSSRFSFVGSTNELGEIRNDGILPVDLEHYRLSWSGPAGGGQSALSAQLIDEVNHFSGGLSTVHLPEASRSWNVRGSYRRDLSGSTSLRTGLSYRQRQGFDPALPGAAPTVDQAIVGLYGKADSQIQPRILVEYGLFSSMSEGGVSLMPHGGVLVDLGSDWTARTSFARRTVREDDDQLGERFTSAFYADGTSCHEVGESCYQVTFARQREGGEESLALGAIHREYAESLRVYFSDDFFDRLESVLMVPGDEMPEVQFRMTRQISPKVLARLESNFASGGGGIFYATDDQPYRNRVRYLVTSLDTRFQTTSTGVFVAFHHLEQNLDPTSEESNPGSAMEVQRLQLMLTQDLHALVKVIPNLAVRVNMEVSRGATPYMLSTDDELYKKLTGGISFSF